MYTSQRKKMLPLNVLDILQRLTDEKHRLSQRDIEKILIDKYDMKVDRRSIKDALMELIEMGFEIQYNEIPRMVKNKETGQLEEQFIYTDFYLERDFSDCEIRLLIDELLDTTYIPYHQRRQLITKLEGLSSIYFRKNTFRDRQPKETDCSGNQLFYTMEIIEEAIASNRKVSFLYRRYCVGENGIIERKNESLLVTPYNMQVVDGDYLLICGETEEWLKLNYISDINITDERGEHCDNKDYGTIEAERGITFVSSEDMLQAFVDEFGSTSIRIEGSGNDMKFRIRTNEKRAVDFAIRYSDQAAISTPKSVRKEVIYKIQKGMERYMMAG